jgi:hypothetical protein
MAEKTKHDRYPLSGASRVPEHRGTLRPETCVGRSFRCGMHALRSGDQANWARAWQELAQACRSTEADKLLVRLAVFVETVEAASSRRIDVLPTGCPGLCRDECLAVSILAASQHGACPALRACAFALLEVSHMDRPLQAATAFADELRCAGFVLSAQSVCNSAALMPMSGGPRN